jgi:dTDP-4-amino-4,6-dideoxygalactose transaminase
VGGNLARQPVMRHVQHRLAGPLSNADLVHHNGLMIGNHADLTAAQEDHLIACIAEFMEAHALRAA